MFRMKTVAISLGLVGLLIACSDSDGRNIVQNVLEDRDFANDIVWPQSPNPACPDWRPGQVVTITESVRLPAQCSYQRVTFALKQANIEFDCNNAVLNGLSKRRRNSIGIPYRSSEKPQRVAFLISNTEAEPKLSNITLKNCQVLNYGMAVDVNLALSAQTEQRLRQKQPIEDELRAKAPQGVQVQNFKILNPHGSGIYIYPYVTHFSLSNSSIKGAGGPGLYLDLGTRGARIQGSTFEGNGFSSYKANLRVRSVRLTETAKREGIAVDASTQHSISHNTFRDNANGGIYLYKNCWEDAATDAKEVPRNDGANQNQITGNQFIDERTGIWLAERADRDQRGFNCGDPVVHQEGQARYHRDFASQNRVANNRFVRNQVGIRVMDDNNVLQDNQFSASIEADIEIGSRIRQLIGDPVKGTVLTRNAPSRADGIRYLYGAQ